MRNIYFKGSASGVRCSLLTSLSVNMIYSRIMRRVIVEKRIIAPAMSSLCVDTTPSSRCMHFYLLIRSHVRFLTLPRHASVGYAEVYLVHIYMSSFPANVLYCFILRFCEYGNTRRRTDLRTCFFSTLSNRHLHGKKICVPSFARRNTVLLVSVSEIELTQ